MSENALLASASPHGSLHLFEAVGIELEYMIVEAETLNVRPIADRLLAHVAGAPAMSVERGDIAWSNELALHVIELKTNGPTRSLLGATDAFQRDIAVMNDALTQLGARLLPTGMHPWMDPHRELRLWPHDDDVIYTTFDRIFDCRGHGWANLQSMHINLPFDGDDEFGRLHAAIRLVLPILPALAASSPFESGRATGFADTRLVHYASNARRIPRVSGLVIPERVFTRADYDDLLSSIYQDLEPHDPDRVLCEEWVNARGAIARFDRNAIEIRVLDTQECPAADLAIASLVIEVVRHLTERALGEPDLFDWPEQRLATILEQCVIHGSDAWIDDADYLQLFTGQRSTPWRATQLWSHLAGQVAPSLAPRHVEHLQLILEAGCLAHRIRRAVGSTPNHARIHGVYQQLAQCLATGSSFE